MNDEGRAVYTVIDGRHRLVKAQREGIKELRCDLITADGHALRIFPVDQLAIDPHVQVDWAFSEIQLRRMGEWNERKAGVITITNGDLSTAEKAEIKNGLDRERRHVSALEGLLIDIERGLPEAIAIQNDAAEFGFKIGRTRGRESGPPHVLGCASALRLLHSRHGSDGMRRIHRFNQRWRADRGANNAAWLGALALLVRDGYDEVASPASLDKLEDVVPAAELRRARGEAIGAGHGLGAGGEISYLVAIRLRRRMGLKVRPVARTKRDGHARPLK